ncbi:MAG: AbrB/MazE/SpoVT family DNA-binding domain-containing protein [Candidatus Omnitrophica bacterium]|nr:AbrB/MazE/SpoVT family DNA-binding domain-containing protein [Candidatus Omnitrophota bacterium]
MIFETTQATPEGQVLVPEAILDKMNVQPGEKFLVTVSGDSILFKRLVEKTQEEADAFWARVKEQRSAMV